MQKLKRTQALTDQGNQGTHIPRVQYEMAISHSLLVVGKAVLT